MDARVAETEAASLRIGGFTFDPRRCRLEGPSGGATLRPKTSEILHHLARNAGRVVTRAELMDTVWPGIFVTDDSITQCLVEARRALGPDASRLRTVMKRGYVLEAEPATADDGVPVLAVLPFDNLARDPRWDLLCDGLVEDMITDFARNPDLRVVARTSSFAWRGKAADIREIGRALGARYVLEGSVQADGAAVGITAQLIEAASGTHLWAERYRREAESVFAIQDEVVASVVGAVAGFSGHVARADLARARRAAPASLRAYELYLLGHEQEARLDREGTLRAIELLEAAVAADPALSRAWTSLGFALANAANNGWGGDVAALRARRVQAIERAVALDPGDSLALVEFGTIRMRQGDAAGTRAAFLAAATAGANHADTLALLAKYLVEVLDDGAAARRLTARSLLLNPFAPAWYRLGATRVAFFTGDFEDAARQAMAAPALRLPRLLRALSLAALGDDSASALAEHRAMFGENGVREALRTLPPLCEAARLLLDDALATAGVQT
jgi:TolB-like protein